MSFKISSDNVSLWAKRLRLTMHFNGFHPPDERLGTNWTDPQGLCHCSTSRSASVWCFDLWMCLAQAAPSRHCSFCSVQLMVFLGQKGMIKGHWGINWTICWCDVKQCKNGSAKWKVNVTYKSFSTKGVMFQLVSITAFLYTQVSET